MSRPDRRRRRGPATPPGRLHGGAHGGDRRPAEDPELITGVKRALRADGPLELLALASTLLAVFDPRSNDPIERTREPDLAPRREFIDSLIGVPAMTTTALLEAFTHLLDDPLLAARMLREITQRAHRLPRWLTDLTPLRPTDAMRISDVYGDTEDIVVGVQTLAGDHLTAMVQIDRNSGNLLIDAFVIDQPVAHVRERMAGMGQPDLHATDMDLADTRARLEDAIRWSGMTVPMVETETWPASRALVEWLIQALPEGGTSPEPPEWDDDQREALLQAILTSPYARGFTDDDRDLLHTLLWFACDYGPGDPMRWSPSAVEILLLDWLPRKVVADVAYLARAPRVLRVYIQWAGEQKGWRRELIGGTLATVDELEADYQRIIRTPRPQGPMALLAAMGAIDEGDAIGAWPPGLPVDAPMPPVAWLFDAATEELRAQALESFMAGQRERVRRLLEAQVGGAEALHTLTDEPLPDEPVAWAAVPESVRDRAKEIIDLLDACCQQFFDREHRTAMRRFVVDVAAASPRVFARGRPDRTAAAIAWIVASANRSFESWSGGLTVKAMAEGFGLTGAPSDRAATLVAAVCDPEPWEAGDWMVHSVWKVDRALGTPRYLTGARRRFLLDMREQFG